MVRGLIPNMLARLFRSSVDGNKVCSNTLLSTLDWYGDKIVLVRLIMALLVSILLVV